jgi:ribonuclease Y
MGLAAVDIGYPAFITVVLILLLIALGWVLRMVYGWWRRESAERQSARVVAEAQLESERIRKEAGVLAKEETFRHREEFDREMQEARTELRRWEQRLTRREDGLDSKVDLLTKKEQQLDESGKELTRRLSQVSQHEQEVTRLQEQATRDLQRISGLSTEEAKRVLLDRLSRELEEERAELIRKTTEAAQEEADRAAATIISTAIQRCAADHTAENVVSTIDIPSDDMKGRIIGREGRNIRAFEKATGVDVIVDDTPGVVVVSGFNGVRREIARRALEKLIVDGRIHPARIEEVVQATEKEMEQIIQEAGRQAALEVDVRGLNPKVVNLLGRLRFRTSYGQNVLQHSVEVALLTGALAGELNLDVQLAKRCGLLHDMGKATDQEQEGGHPELGADILRRFQERPEVIDAAAGHHADGAIAGSIYTTLVAAADAISASRPGARRETLEHYIKRLERLESIAGGYPGVDKSYAIQAGRELRVIVSADKVPDNHLAKLSRDIAKDIERELTYPGEVKVTVIRETRAVDYAR